MNSGYKKFLNRRKWNTNISATFSLPATPDTNLYGTHSFQLEIFLLNDAEIGFYLDPYGTRAATASFFLNYIYTGAPQTYKITVPGLTGGGYTFRTTMLTSTYSNEFGSFYEGGSFEPNLEFSGKGPYFEPVLDLASCPIDGSIDYLSAPTFSTSVTTTGVILNWTQVNLSVGYSIDRSTDAINWNSIDVTDANTFSLTDATFLPNTTYYYRIKSVGNSYNLLDSSFTQSTVVTGLKKLSTPIISVTSKSSDSITFGWIDVTNEVNYQIKRSNQFDGVYTVVGTVNNTTYVDTGLSSSTVYHYKLVAKGNGTSYVDSDESSISVLTN